MKKIVTSIGMIVFAAAIIAGGTGAFFSDTETSQANTFTAGAIDLTVDSEAHYNGSICRPNLTTTENQTDYTWQGGNEYPVGLPCTGTWEATDLGAQTFFNFNDVKPGDEGENTISLHITSNPAWACVDVNLTKNDDVSSTEPELDGTGDVANLPSLMDGELAENIKFAAWLDQGNTPGWQNTDEEEEVTDSGEGDNIWQGEEKEPLLFSNESGPASDVLGGKSYTLAAPNVNGGLPMAPNVTNYIGLAWCAGTQDVDTAFNTITCDGSTLGNIVQTDMMEASIAFRVEQSRNNEDFRCEPEEETIVWTEDGTRTGGDVAFIVEEPRGNVLQLTTIDDNDSRVRWNNNNLNIDLSTFTGVSFESKQVSVPVVAATYGNATMRLIVDLDGNLLTLDTEEITYEPYYNLFGENSLNDVAMIANTWQQWDTTLANGKFWGNGGFLGTTPSGGAYATNVTLAQVLAAYPSAKIVGINLGMGTWNPDQVILVDNLVINGSPVSLEN